MDQLVAMALTGESSLSSLFPIPQCQICWLLACKLVRNKKTGTSYRHRPTEGSWTTFRRHWHRHRAPKTATR